MDYLNIFMEALVILNKGEKLMKIAKRKGYKSFIVSFKNGLKVK